MSQEFTVENVLATLPAFPKGAPQQRAKRAAEALVKAQNYSRQMALQQVRNKGLLELKILMTYFAVSGQFSPPPPLY